MNTLSKKDRDRAETIGSTFLLSGHAIDAIAQALADARPPAGHIIDDQGVVRKVLGTLPVTGDGCIVGDGASIVAPLPYGDWINLNPVFDKAWYHHANSSRPVGIPWEMCYSTREAALAAKEPQA